MGEGLGICQGVNGMNFRELGNWIWGELTGAGGGDYDTGETWAEGGTWGMSNESNGRQNFPDRALYTRDNLEVLRGMNSETVDLIATDPPFNTARNRAGTAGFMWISGSGAIPAACRISGSGTRFIRSGWSR